jgi:hypothetical protein
MDEAQLSWLWEILQKNKDKTFVKRILDPDKYPTLDFGDGNWGTHKMSYMQFGDKYRVFPTILFNGKELQQFQPKEAWKHVNKTGNYIEFDDESDADFFSKNYKAFWK